MSNYCNAICEFAVSGSTVNSEIGYSTNSDGEPELAAQCEGDGYVEKIVVYGLMGDIDPSVDPDKSFQVKIKGLVNPAFELDAALPWTLETRRHQFGEVEYILEKGSCYDLDLEVSPFEITSASCIPANSWTYSDGPLKKCSEDEHTVPAGLSLYTEIRIDLPQLEEGDRVYVALDHEIIYLPAD